MQNENKLKSEVDELKDFKKVYSLEEAVCSIMPGEIPVEDLKEHMPDLNEIVKLLGEDEFF